jgi:hypothetical protein
MRILCFVAGGFLGWYLGTQEEAKTRQIYEQLKLEANKLKSRLQEEMAKNDDLKMQVGIEEDI